MHTFDSLPRLTRRAYLSYLNFCLGQIPLFRVPLALGAAPQIASGLSMLCCNGPGTFLCAVEIVSVLFS